MADDCPACGAPEIFGGHVITGGGLLNTVTAKKQVAVFEEASVAVHDTLVAPGGKLEPDGGEQATLGPGQLSVAVGAGYVTTTEDWPALIGTEKESGQTIFGGVLSMTITLNEQLEPAAVQVTVVAPTGKDEPGGGVQVTVPQAPLGNTE